ncbi:hypothetical protein VUR80DRAFT_7514 [Thermomyces stellatus]
MHTPSQSTANPLTDDTIYALSSATGRAAISVIRVSGPAASDVYKSLCPDKPLPKPRSATVRTLFHPTEKPTHVLDSSALILFFPGPKTATGEDILELHVHGGRATVKSVLSAIPLSHSGQGRIRYAEPGEFTRRAFYNDRLDLAQIDALGETLAAETEQQRRAAERGNSQVLSQRYESWRNQLLLARGEIEALIDFSEDQHFDESPSELLGNVTEQVTEILHSIRLHDEGSRRSQLLRSGIRIALLGPPNVGKSSLMNHIVGKEASIVSSEAGTTRDIVEVSLDVRGYLCSFADTAGFRGEELTELGEDTAVGAIEREGIRRARSKAVSSDIVIVLGAITPDSSEGFHIVYDEQTLRLAAEHKKPTIVAINKRDVVDEGRLQVLVSEFHRTLKATPGLENTPLPITISCTEAGDTSLRTPDPGGIHALTDQLLGLFEGMTSMPSDLQDLLGVTERQRQLLDACRQHLEHFIAEAQPGEGGSEADIVLAAEHLRYAANALAKITGRGEVPDVEDVLGVIFEKFCVGK